MTTKKVKATHSQKNQFEKDLHFSLERFAGFQYTQANFNAVGSQSERVGNARVRFNTNCLAMRRVVEHALLKHVVECQSQVAARRIADACRTHAVDKTQSAKDIVKKHIRESQALAESC